MPVHYPDQTGKPYRPGNGTEGMIFMAQWCSKCSKDTEADPCLIIDAAMLFDLKHPSYPCEWIHDENGHPSCTAFEHVGGAEVYRCPDTLDMFEGKP